MFILAESEMVAWTAVIVASVAMVVGLATAIIVLRVQRDYQLQDEERAESKQKIAAMEAAIGGASHANHELVEKLVDERFRAVSHEVRNVAQSLVNTIEEIKTRLSDGEGTFNALSQTDHQLELKLITRVDQLKDWMRETFAGRGDLKEHELSVTRKFEHLEKHLGEVSTQVAVLADKTKGGKAS